MYQARIGRSVVEEPDMLPDETREARHLAWTAGDNDDGPGSTTLLVRDRWGSWNRRSASGASRDTQIAIQYSRMAEGPWNFLASMGDENVALVELDSKREIDPHPILPQFPEMTALVLRWTVGDLGSAYEKRYDNAVSRYKWYLAGPTGLAEVSDLNVGEMFDILADRLVEGDFTYDAGPQY